MLGFRFSYMYKLHAESFMGFNAVCLPGNQPGAFYRSSLPATPVSTPIRENGRFSAQALRERLCRTPSPRKYRLFEPRASEPDIGFNAYGSGLQLSSPDDEIEEEASFPNPTRQFHLQESKVTSTRLKRKVFVGNLGYNVKKHELHTFFSKFGRVLDCLITHDYILGHSRGYAFVVFSNVEDAQKAQDAPRKELELAGRVLRVFPCHEKKSSRYKREAREIMLNWNPNNGFPDKGDCSESGLVNSRGRMYRRRKIQNLSDLTDDALLLIFSYLSIQDKVKLESVCRKWKCLAIHVWRNTKSLNLKGAFTDNQPLTNDILFSLLKKCGRGLEKLDLACEAHQLTFKCGELIALLCPNLESLDLNSIPITNDALRLLATNCKKLKRVSLRHTRDISEKGLWWLLHLCRDIEDFDLSENSNVTGQSLHMVNPMIKKLSIGYCNQFGQPGLLKIATKCQQLVYLDLCNCRALDKRALALLCQSLHELRELRLEGRFENLKATALDEIGRLTNLEKLSLCGNMLVNKGFLNSLAVGCRKLESLDLSATPIMDDEFSELAGMYSLKKLKINDLRQLTDDGFSNLSRHCGLEHLEMRSCFSVGDQGLVSLLAVSSRLRYLDLSGCDGVTNVTLRSCYDAVASRQNTYRKPLYLIVGGTNIHNQGLDFEPHPLLKVSFLDYRNHPLPGSNNYSGDNVKEVDSDEEDGAYGGETPQPQEEEEGEDTRFSNFSWAEVAEYPL